MTDPDEFRRTALGWLIIAALAVYAALSPEERRLRREWRQAERAARTR